MLFSMTAILTVVSSIHLLLTTVGRVVGADAKDVIHLIHFECDDTHLLTRLDEEGFPCSNVDTSPPRRGDHRGDGGLRENKIGLQDSLSPFFILLFFHIDAASSKLIAKICSSTQHADIRRYTDNYLSRFNEASEASVVFHQLHSWVPDTNCEIQWVRVHLL